LAPLFAGDRLTGSGANPSKILRNDTNVGGSTSTSTSHKLFSSLGTVRISSSLTTTSNYIFPGIGNLIVHPNAIITLSGSESGQGQITLTWTAPTIVDGVTVGTGSYLIRWSTQNALNSETNFEAATTYNQSFTPLDPGQTENRILTGFPYGSTVYLAVKGQDNAINTAYTSSGTATLNGVFVSSAVSAPTQVSVTADATTILHWEWVDSIGNETGYRLVASSGGAASGDLAANTTFYIQTGLSGPNTNYAAFVQAFNVSWSSNSITLSSYTLAALPVTAASTYTFVGPYTITAQWLSGGNPNNTRYRLQTATSSSFIGTVTSSDTFLVNATTRSLTPVTSYFFQVSAFNNDNIQTAYLSLGSTQTPPVILSLTLDTTFYQFGFSSASVILVSSSAVIVTNSGNVSENYVLRATTATAGTPCIIGSTPGADRFVLQSIFHPSQPSSENFASEDVLTVNNQSASSTIFSAGSETGVNVDLNAARNLWFQIQTPTGISTDQEQIFKVTITAEQSP
jgi:hypothetical protein